MSWSMAIFTFINAWWIMLFFVLPFRLKLRRTFVWNTLLALLVTAGLALIIRSGVIDVRN